MTTIVQLETNHTRPDITALMTMLLAKELGVQPSAIKRFDFVVETGRTRLEDTDAQEG